MKTILPIFVSFLLFFGCTDEPEAYVWEDESFAERIEIGANEFISSINSGKFFHGYSLISVKLNKFNYNNNQKSVNYIYVYDSISAELNGNSVLIDYSFSGDTLVEISPRTRFNESGNLNLKLYVSWYFKDTKEPRYTDGEPEFFGNETEQFQVDIEFFSYFQKKDLSFTYPLDRQFNFLIDEYEKGYFKIKDNNFVSFMAKQDLSAIITSIETDDFVISTISFNQNLNVFEFALPDTFLKEESMYKIAYSLNDSIFYEFYFRTSFYKTFLAKWNNENLLQRKNGVWTDNVDLGVHSINLNIYPVVEEMDNYESYIYSRYSSTDLPLIRFNSDIPEVMKNTKEMAMYSMPDLDIKRETKYAKYGFPPLDAIYFRCRELSLTDEYLNGQEFEPTIGYNWQYFVTALASIDYNNVWSQIGDLNSDLERVDDKVFGHTSNFSFPLIDVYYILPGIELTTTKIENYKIQ